MTVNNPDFWSGVAAMCVVGLIYFGGETIRDELQEIDQSPWRWGNKPRRMREPATWGTHLVLGPSAMLLAGFTTNMLLRFG